MESNGRKPLKYFAMHIVLVVTLAASPIWAAQGVPTSHRSKRAIERVQVQLSSELSVKGLRLGAPIFLRIMKEEAILEVWIESGERFELYKAYPICSFSGVLGPKLAEGDNQAPEGFYFVTPRAMNPQSSYHLSFNLGYPNRYDRYHKRTGSYLMVHGNCVSIGCYAMTDEVIEEVWTLVDAAFRGGQPFFRVHIFPFIMTESNMLKHQASPWADFWKNLEVGHRKFETTRQPPNVEVDGGRYVFTN
jgi:murein L,D-transpeptidase YafK